MDAVLPKKKGPVPQGYVDTHIQVEPWLLEWGKQQPGGFGALVRALLKEKYDRQQKRKGTGS
jgi:hypothetical protein